MGWVSYNPHQATLGAESSLAMKLLNFFYFFLKKPKLGHGFFLDPSPSSILGAKSSLMRNKNPSQRLNLFTMIQKEI
jgi:hypothetical protein